MVDLDSLVESKEIALTQQDLLARVCGFWMAYMISLALVSFQLSFLYTIQLLGLATGKRAISVILKS